jgi:hypothetical protein
MTEAQIEANKAKFNEMYQIYAAVLDTIDQHFKSRLREMYGKKISSVEEGFGSRKDFLLDAEEKAIRSVSKQTGKTLAHIRDRWNAMTLPSPIYSCLEEGTITLSRAKLVEPLNLAPEDKASIEVAESLVEVMINSRSNDKVVEAVSAAAKLVWNQSTAVMEWILGQHERGEI